MSNGVTDSDLAIFRYYLLKKAVNKSSRQQITTDRELVDKHDELILFLMCIMRQSKRCYDGK